MSFLKSALLCGLVAVGLSACASTNKPGAGSVPRAGRAGLFDPRGKIDDPRVNHVACLRAAGIPVSEPAPREIQVGQAGVGPLIRFLATPGMAQGAQIAGESQPAEVIGSALLYPKATTTERLLKTVESCTAVGVKG
jgi:hypothetical protein